MQCIKYIKPHIPSYSALEVRVNKIVTSRGNTLKNRAFTSRYFKAKELKELDHIIINLTLMGMLNEVNIFFVYG